MISLYAQYSYKTLFYQKDYKAPLFLKWVLIRIPFLIIKRVVFLSAIIWEGPHCTFFTFQNGTSIVFLASYSSGSVPISYGSVGNESQVISRIRVYKNHIAKIHTGLRFLFQKFLGTQPLALCGDWASSLQGMLILVPLTLC